MKLMLAIVLELAIIHALQAQNIDNISDVHKSLKSNPPQKTVLTDIYTDKPQSSLPARVDNRNMYLRPLFQQLGWSCGSSNGVSLAFTYEINMLRDLSSQEEKNQYPYCYTYHFLNDGSGQVGTHLMCMDAWDIIKENGIPTVSDYGGFTTGYPTRWVNGYDTYFKGMHNRVSNYSYFTANTLEGQEEIKQWLYDHGNSSSVGGVAIFFVSHRGTTIYKLAPGTPEQGKYVVSKFGTQLETNHTMTVVGYDDSVRYDYNNDGIYTVDTDINGDGKVDLKDREIGAFIVINLYDANWADNYCAYALYNLFATPQKEGGIGEDFKVYIVQPIKSYEPKLTYKVTLTHSSRQNIKIATGLSIDTTVNSPTHIKEYKKQFNYAGGDFPMEGKDMSSTIEIGLDITDFMDVVQDAKNVKFFLQVTSKGGTGQINKFSLMDYTASSVQEKQCTQTDVPISSGSTTTLAITYQMGATQIDKSIMNHNGNKLRCLSINSSASNRNIRFIFPSYGVKEAELIVTNLAGKQVYSGNITSISMFTDEYITASWNGVGDSGTKIATGIYSAVVRQKQGKRVSRQLQSVFIVW